MNYSSPSWGVWRGRVPYFGKLSHTGSTLYTLNPGLSRAQNPVVKEQSCEAAKRIVDATCSECQPKGARVEGLGFRVQG